MVNATTARTWSKLPPISLGDRQWFASQQMPTKSRTDVHLADGRLVASQGSRYETKSDAWEFASPEPKRQTLATRQVEGGVQSH